jgi:phosphoglycerate kinase
MAIKYLRSANIKSKTALVRVDVNVPLDERGNVSDSFRIEAILPTLEYLEKSKCKIILCGHLGRPEGKSDKKLSLRPVAETLAKLLKRKFVETKDKLPDYDVPHVIFFAGDWRTEKNRAAIASADNSHIIVLENLRFYPEEEAADVFFAKQLAALADVYVNDAFAVDHRKAASITAVAKYLPSYAGLQLEQELMALSRVVARPKSPFVVLMGGIKITDKAKTLQNLGKKSDSILLAGGIANLFFLSRGYEIGQSKVEKEAVKLAFQMDKNFKGKLVLPLDVVVANKAMDRDSIRACSPHQVRKHELILDIGPKTILHYAKILKQAKTLVWNGPLGFFEHKPFHHGTMALARVIGGVSQSKAFGVVGGGETVDAVRQAHQADMVDHLSTGGGAMLEFLAGSKLPGVVALEK